MSNSVLRNLLFAAMCICPGVANRMAAAVGSEPVTQDAPTTPWVKKPQRERGSVSWHSPKIHEVQKDWETLYHSWEGRSWSPLNYNKRWDMLDGIFATRLSDADLCDLAASCGTLPTADKDWGEFERALFDYIARVFVHKADRDSLVTLLSTRCPSVVNGMRPEYWLVVGAERFKLKDPVLILGEAYANCRIPEVRRDIATRYRHAFTALGVSGKDDDEFVKNATQFYKDEKDNLRLNQIYDANYHAGLPDPDLYKRNPLFKRGGS